MREAPHHNWSVERGTQYLHSLAVRTLLDMRVPFQDVSFDYVEALCREYFILREGSWYLSDDEQPPSPIPTGQIDWLKDGRE